MTTFKTAAAALALIIAGSSAAVALPPGAQLGKLNPGLQPGKLQINPGALKPGGVKLGQLPGGGLKIPGGKPPTGGPHKIPGLGKGYGYGVVAGMTLGAIAAYAPAYADEEESCAIVRKPVVDAFGDVVMRRIVVCE